MRSLLKTIIAVSLVCGLSGCAHVNQQYAAYEGRNAEQQGEGGTRFSSDGIDFWTTGMPPRRYKILGVLTDTRRNQKFAAASFASDVATKVREIGGNAVIYQNEGTEYIGTYNMGQATATSYGNTANVVGSGFGVAISNKSTQLLVIKYLDD